MSSELAGAGPLGAVKRTSHWQMGASGMGTATSAAPANQQSRAWTPDE